MGTEVIMSVHGKRVNRPLPVGPTGTQVDTLPHTHLQLPIKPAPAMAQLRPPPQTLATIHSNSHCPMDSPIS